MKAFACALLTSVLAAAAAHAASGGIGDLLVTPTRIVLDPRVRTAEIALINTGNTTTTYRIDLQHLRMKPNGDIVPAENEPAEAFADSLVQFSPRRIVLEPHITQTVRLRMRGVPASGEVYVHLLFHGEPPEDAAPAAADPRALSIKLTPIYGVAVPVIVRAEEPRQEQARQSVHIGNLRLADGGALAFDLERSIDRSTYGDVAVSFTPRGGAAKTVGVEKGISVYMPLTARTVILPLHPPGGVALRGGTLQVSYVDAERIGTSETVATLDVP